ncbi:unnamed protein product [Strongylus vulgaris]|uniref:Uncharacterized protein n=1 Tax=Strongylus vulgaris TaxID=40348 RepID=A0A3P7JFA8_STRVU|nr:unnamed protein product [Strongylus vulgaris]
MVDLTLLDASATREDFTVGMSGRVSSTKSGIQINPILDAILHRTMCRFHFVFRKIIIGEWLKLLYPSIPSTACCISPTGT